jgi:hypothetical protein
VAAAAEPRPKLSEERQREQGTGTVLGDSTAKSNSIGNSLEMLRANSDADLSFSSAMLGSLRLIESNTKSLAAFAARSGLTGQGANVPQGGDGNSFSLSDVGIIIGRYLGGSSEHARFGAQSLGSLINDPQGRRYTDITRTHTGAMGRTYDATNTDYDALQAELTAGIRRVAIGLRDTLAQAVNILTGGRHSVEEIQGLLNQVNIDVHRISFKDLKGDDIQAALQAVFSAIGDNMVDGAHDAARFRTWICARSLPARRRRRVRDNRPRREWCRASRAPRWSASASQMIDWKDIADKQGDVATEIIRDSIVNAEKGNPASGDHSRVRRLGGRPGPALSEADRRPRGNARVGDDAQNLSQAMIQGAGGLTALQRGLEAFRQILHGRRAREAASRELRRRSGSSVSRCPRRTRRFPRS